MEENTQDIWLSIPQYCQSTGVSISSIRRYIKSGRVEHRFIQGKYYIKSVSNEIPPRNRAPALHLQLEFENQELRRKIQKQQEELAELKMLLAIYEKKNEEIPPELPF